MVSGLTPSTTEPSFKADDIIRCHRFLYRFYFFLYTPTDSVLVSWSFFGRVLFSNIDDFFLSIRYSTIQLQVISCGSHWQRYSCVKINFNGMWASHFIYRTFTNEHRKKKTLIGAHFMLVFQFVRSKAPVIITSSFSRNFN